MDASHRKTYQGDENTNNSKHKDMLSTVLVNFLEGISVNKHCSLMGDAALLSSFISPFVSKSHIPNVTPSQTEALCYQTGLPKS